MTQIMRIAMVAGEVSGDTLGAGLIKALQQRYPQAQFEGIGGPQMIECGFKSVVPMERLSVMGFVEPLSRLPELLRIKKNLQNQLIANPPDVFVGIDSPGFNLRVERVLHDHGIRTVHYVSPSVWAWGEKRIHEIARAVDMVLALFPFETDIYERHRIGVRFIGHPLADKIDPNADDAAVRSQARAELGIAAQVPVVALLPGSRRDEIKRLGPVFIQTALKCLENDPALQFVLPCANEARRQQLSDLIAQAQVTYQSQSGKSLRSGIFPAERFHLLEGRSHTAMLAADLVLLASGTATLEAMLHKRPMVVCYRLAPLTYALASRMLKVPYVSLPNLLANKALVPEFLQHAVTAPALSAAVRQLLADPQGREELIEQFTDIHHRIRCNASEQAAAAVAEIIERRSGLSSSKAPQGEGAS